MGIHERKENVINEMFSKINLGHTFLWKKIL